MKYLNPEIENELKNQGAELIRFVGISHLNEKQNRQLPNAIVFALPLTAEYAKMVFNIPDYVQARIADNYNFDDDEYSQTEHKAGEFNFETKESILPHKTVALLGGLGWIGKNNLLITPEYGAAQCLGTVLTDAPLETVLHEPLSPKCGNCITCVNICERKVLKGKVWSRSVSRDEIVNIHGCSTCLKCLVHCPRTQTYIKRNIV